MARLVGADNNEDIPVLTSRKYYNKALTYNFSRISPIFSPEHISGLHLWYKSSSLSLSHGDTVSSWGDSSGNGISAAQGTTSLQPTFQSTSNTLNGYPTVYFDGVDDYLIGDISGNTLNNRSCTVFAIYIPHATTSQSSGYLFTSAASGSSYGNRTFYMSARNPAKASVNMNFGPGMVAAVGNGSFANTANCQIPFMPNPSYDWGILSRNKDIEMPFPDFMILGFTCLDSTANLRDEYYTSVNGFTGIQKSAYVVNYSKDMVEIRIGAAKGISFSEFKGYLAELIVYDSSVIGENHDKVVGYLAHKYKVTNVLHEKHPYKLGPP